MSGPWHYDKKRRLSVRKSLGNSVQVVVLAYNYICAPNSPRYVTRAPFAERWAQDTEDMRRYAGDCLRRADDFTKCSIACSITSYHHHAGAMSYRQLLGSPPLSPIGPRRRGPHELVSSWSSHALCPWGGGGGIYHIGQDGVAVGGPHLPIRQSWL